MTEALNVIAESGVANLSLREVARRLSVSHQAPYKHFQNREHLLAEAIGRAYEELGKVIQARPHRDNPAEDLGEIGEAYLRFAEQKPLHYRLLFELPSPELAVYEGVEAKAAVAFEMLLVAVTRLTEIDDLEFNKECSLFAWASVHGLASIAANQILPAIGFFEAESQVKVQRGSLRMICGAIQARAEASRENSTKHGIKANS